MYQIHESVRVKELTDDKNQLNFFGILMCMLVARFLKQVIKASMFECGIKATVETFQKIIDDRCEINGYFQKFLPSISEWFNKDDDYLAQSEIEQIKEPSRNIIIYLFGKNPDVLKPNDIEKLCREYFDFTDYQKIGTYYL